MCRRGPVIVWFEGITGPLTAKRRRGATAYILASGPKAGCGRRALAAGRGRRESRRGSGRRTRSRSLSKINGWRCGNRASRPGLSCGARRCATIRRSFLPGRATLCGLRSVPGTPALVRVCRQLSLPRSGGGERPVALRRNSGREAVRCGRGDAGSRPASDRRGVSGGCRGGRRPPVRGSRKKRFNVISIQDSGAERDLRARRRDGRPSADRAGAERMGAAAGRRGGTRAQRSGVERNLRPAGRRRRP